MKSKIIYGVALYLVIACNSYAVSNDKLDSQLIGRHPLTLHWINTDLNNAGEVNIRRYNGMLQLSGTQVGKGYAKGDYISIQGMIAEYSKNSLKLTGKIITRLRFDNSGLPCVMEGDFLFKKRNGKKYFRLQEAKSACSTTTNHIDIYIY
ncbi:MAG: hypothetical protein ACRCVV_09050 [Shewanella sp.]